MRRSSRDWNIEEIVNSARAAAVKRVSSQSKSPDQKIISRAVVAICCLKASTLLSRKRLESVGKAAREYETPMIERGTDWRLREKERTETEPAVISEAMETKKMVAILVIDKVSVRGREILITFPIVVKSSDLKEGLGKRPDANTNGTCTKTCRLAPSTTPIATPVIPNRSASRIIPTIMPALYKIGERAYIVKRL